MSAGKIRDLFSAGRYGLHCQKERSEIMVDKEDLGFIVRMEVQGFIVSMEDQGFIVN